MTVINREVTFVGTLITLVHADAAQEARTNGTFTFVDRVMTTPELNRFFPEVPERASPAARVAQCRGTKLKPSRVQVQVLPRGPIWNVHRTSVPGLGANECVRSGSGASPRHSACACSLKRTVRLVRGDHGMDAVAG